MRDILSVFAISGAVLVAGVVPAAAEAACAGNACAALSVAADGCVWVNKGDKAVRLSLLASGTARMVTVLAPGESFKEPDKKFCLKEGGDAARYEATFAVLAKMPDEDGAPVLKTAKPTPRPKPEMVMVAAAQPAAPAAAAEVAVASVGSSVPLPRAKPALPAAIYPPAPRAKPEVVAVAEATVPVAPAAPAAVVQPAAAVESAAAQPVAVCSANCPPILFKVIDDCLWVLNLNPRPVAFEAEVGGKRTTLALEAADGEKADAQASGKAGKADGTMHMRLADPFQSAGSGIPVYRARLGSASACVKSRGEIARFTAGYVK